MSDAPVSSDAAATPIGPAAPGGPVPPAGLGFPPPVQPAGEPSPLRNAVKWVLAMLGVFVSYLSLQVVIGMAASIVIAAVESFISVRSGAPVEDAFFDNGIQVVMVATQLLAIAVFWPWWRRVRRNSLRGCRESAAEAARGAREGRVGEPDAERGGVPDSGRSSHGNGAATAKTVIALLLIGIAMQYVIGVALGVVETFFPDAMADYAELMEESATGVFALVAMVSVAVLAPINEEIVCRGLMLEYAMRAVSPCWNARDRASRCSVSPRAFWTANMMQALAFGVLHLNLIQGSYAFALGILEGWVFWRTGKLRYPMILHFALNASSYLVQPLAPMVNALPYPVLFVLSAAILVAGIVMFGRTWRVSNAASEGTAIERDGVLR